MADMTGFQQLGTALGGDSELAYQQGLNLGARTEDALAQARARVDQNKAREELAGTLEKVLPPDIAAASAQVLRAGGNLGDVINTISKNQEVNFRNIAGSADPNVDAGARNRALTGVASGPVEPFRAVGAHGYQDIYHPDQGVMPLGADIAGAGGGDASGIQYARMLDLIDPATGKVKAGREGDFYDIIHPTGKTFEAGDVPYATNFNPFRAPAGRPAPAATGGQPIAPQKPIAAPAQAVVPVATTAANAGAVASGKKQGEAQGEKAAALPSTLAKLDDFEHNVDNLLAQPGFDTIYGHLAGTDTGQSISAFASQDAANAQAALQQIDAQSFGISIQQMRGLGQLSNQEGLKVQKAFTLATNPRLAPDAAKTAFLDLKNHLAELRRVANIEAGGGSGSAPTFASEAEAEAAGLAPGTRVIINGVSGTWQ